MSAILELDRVHARDAAGPFGRARGSLTGASIALGPGVHAFLGAPEDGTLALLDVVSGARPPLRGRVLVTGRDPARTSFMRARIGVLEADPRLPSASSVQSSVRLAMQARGETGDRVDAVLDPLGLGHLHARDPRSLSFAEQRAVELALAISTPAPALLVLHEPFADVAVARTPALHLRLREAAGAGACVVLTTSSPADARALAERVVVLHKGLVAREAVGGGLVLGESIALDLWVRAGARELAAALALRPEVRSVAWEEHADGLSSIQIEGTNERSCSLAVIEAALDVGVDIDAMTSRSPGLGEVRATTEVLRRTRPAPPVLPTVPAPVPAAAPPPLPTPEPDRTATPPPEPPRGGIA